MGATAEERLAKRRINELEEKLKKLQRELRELKTEKKHAGHLRKQLERAAQTEAEYKEVIEQQAIADQEHRDEDAKKKKRKIEVDYKCKNLECATNQGFYAQSECDVIDVGSRLIIVCKECGSRYALVKSTAAAS